MDDFPPRIWQTAIPSPIIPPVGVLFPSLPCVLRWGETPHPGAARCSEGQRLVLAQLRFVTLGGSGGGWGEGWGLSWQPCSQPVCLRICWIHSRTHFPLQLAEKKEKARHGEMKCDSVQGLRGIRAGESRALGTICPPGASLSLRGENGGWGGGGGV